MKDAIADGIWRKNPATVQLLGLCPLLAVSYNVRNALGLAAASSFVLIGSSLTISSIRRIIPDNIRLPCFVLVIATLTTLATMFMEAFAFSIYTQVALFVQIIVTNCMILGHIESVAFKQPVGTSLANAVGTAVGFSGALVALGTIRQTLGPIVPLIQQPVGAFLTTGLCLACLNAATRFIDYRLLRRASD